MVSVEGSNTMTELMQLWAKAFMQKHPNVPVSVSSDDSGSGISALINKTTDLAAASRDLTAEESKLAVEHGEQLKKITVAGDAIVVLVNNANPIDTLTLDQLRDVFEVTTKNWRKIGGKNAPIQVYSREKESGTYSYFKQHVLKDGSYADSAKELHSAEAISSAVEKDPSAIAYEGLASASNVSSKVKFVKLKLNSAGEAIAPTQASAIGAYPLSRPLILFVDSRAKGSVRQFVDFCTSDDGQNIAREAGYIRLK